MLQDQAPQMRMSIRTAPGSPPGSRRSIGRNIWVGTTRFISFLGSLTRPFAEGWYLAGGPGGQGAIVLANFMSKFGAPEIQHINEEVYIPRVSASPYDGIQSFNQTANNQVKISTEVSDSIQDVLETRYEATMGVVQDGHY